ncbi:protein spire homolog 1 isoform X1 [Salmo salar]|uniref:Protein spire homolog 1 isoform X1 n=2 Tax=Salmo salar TaxID=8030 RepID=A0A1S3Q2Y2_SALSA|nr:protein spire homolog 1-like isoform X1 [Salmo salar]|eukprot:XP_014034307.1 PREDICTED: protein spire homolog 1-like isoform X5 [Salmo salar]
MLISPTLLQDIRVDQYLNSWDMNMDIADGSEDLSLEEILSLYSQPINEEQAWAVCYQCCRTLARKHRKTNSKTSGSSVGDLTRRIEGPGDVRILRDGTVTLHHQDSTDKSRPPNTSLEVIESLGIMIYKALDYSLKESEERELSPPLEQLIDMMTNMAEKERDSDPCPDEGYEATEEEEDEGDPNTVCHVKGFRDIIMLCTSHLPSPSDAPNHYQAVCRALYTETRELRTFLEKIRSAKENLRRMEGDTREEPVRDLNELQNADWAKFWMQVMGDLRNGVKLKKVQERQYSPLPIEFQLTPYEMLMDDIRFKRYKLRNVMLNGDIPPRLKKSAHDVILDFIRSRPPLNPVAARKLKPHPARPRSLHERLLEGIKQERKLRPVSPDMTRRSHLGAVKSISTPQDLNRCSDLSSPDALRKHASSSSTQALSCPPAHEVGGALGQRKRLLKAPTLAELYSSESDDESSHSSSSLSTSILDASSPESVLGKNTPPRFLPISMTPQPDSRPSPQRRRSIEKEPPTSVRPFTAPTRQSSKSLEDFCYPVECLALTVEEVMHIRQVLVKAELEKFQQYKDIYNALRKGKLCFSCQTKRFSFFTWSYTCQFCKRPVCSQCCKKMRLPSKPYANLSVSSLGPTDTLPREEAGGTSALDTPEKPSSSQHHSLTVSRLSEYNSGEGSRDEPELDLPKELTDDWCTMEVCINCKKFISEIVCSSKLSLTLATKRARLKRKTQSFYLSSPNTDDYRPSERTVNQV